jgi:hypothetical protein
VFGNINDEVFKQLDFALAAVQAERGHRLEPEHHNKRLRAAEVAIRDAISALELYRKEGQ